MRADWSFILCRKEKIKSLNGLKIGLNKSASIESVIKACCYRMRSILLNYVAEIKQNPRNYYDSVKNRLFEIHVRTENKPGQHRICFETEKIKQVWKSTRGPISMESYHRHIVLIRINAHTRLFDDLWPRLPAVGNCLTCSHFRRQAQCSNNIFEMC